MSMVKPLFDDGHRYVRKEKRDSHEIKT